jgi:hypothetical protein
MCYCTFPEDRGQVSLLQLSGPGINVTEGDAYLIHQLLASNRLRLKLWSKKVILHKKNIIKIKN